MEGGEGSLCSHAGGHKLEESELMLCNALTEHLCQLHCQHLRMALKVRSESESYRQVHRQRTAMALSC